MSQENVEVARAAYDAFNRGDIDGMLDLCTPDIEWQDTGLSLDTSGITGKDAIRAYFESVLEPWDEVRREPEEIIDLDGDRVLVLFRTFARGKGSGVEVDARAGDLVTFKEGKIARWTGYKNRAAALKAVGLAE